MSIDTQAKIPFVKVNHYVINLDRSRAGLGGDHARRRDQPKADRDPRRKGRRARKPGAAGRGGLLPSARHDARPTSEFLPVLEAVTAQDDLYLVNFMHHRMQLFRPDRPLATGRRLGRAMVRPTGGSACYLVNRRAAERLRRDLLPMRSPFDVALERGWTMGLRVRHVSPDLVRTNPETRKRLTHGGMTYTAMKLKPWQRLGALSFRALDLLRRVDYALGSSPR